MTRFSEVLLLMSFILMAFVDSDDVYDLKRRIKSLEKEKIYLEEDNNDLRKKREDYDADVGKLVIDIGNLHILNRQLRQENLEKEKDIKELKSMDGATECHERNNQYMKRLEELEQKLKEVEDERSQLRQEKQALEEDKVRLEEEHTKKDGLMFECGEFANKMANQRHEMLFKVGVMNNTLQAVEKELDNTRIEKEDSQKELTSCTASREGLESTLEKKEMYLKECGALATKASNEKHALKVTLWFLKKRLAAMQLERDQAKDTAEVKDEKLERCKKTKQQLVSDLARMQDEGTKAEEEIGQLKSKAEVQEEFIKECGLMRVSEWELKNKLAAVEFEVKSAIDERDTCQRQLKESITENVSGSGPPTGPALKARIDALEKANEELEAKVEDATDKIKECSLLSTEQMNLFQSLKVTRYFMQKRLDAAVNNATALIGLLQEAEADIVDLEEENADLETEKEELSNNLKECADLSTKEMNLFQSLKVTRYFMQKRLDTAVENAADLAGKLNATQTDLANKTQFIEHMMQRGELFMSEINACRKSYTDLAEKMMEREEELLQEKGGAVTSDDESITETEEEEEEEEEDEEEEYEADMDQLQTSLRECAQLSTHQMNLFQSLKVTRYFMQKRLDATVDNATNLAEKLNVTQTELANKTKFIEHMMQRGELFMSEINACRKSYTDLAEKMMEREEEILQEKRGAVTSDDESITETEEEEEEDEDEEDENETVVDQLQTSLRECAQLSTHQMNLFQSLKVTRYFMQKRLDAASENIISLNETISSLNKTLKYERAKLKLLGQDVKEYRHDLAECQATLNEKTNLGHESKAEENDQYSEEKQYGKDALSKCQILLSEKINLAERMEKSLASCGMENSKYAGKARNFKTKTHFLTKRVETCKEDKANLEKQVAECNLARDVRNEDGDIKVLNSVIEQQKGDLSTCRVAFTEKVSKFERLEEHALHCGNENNDMRKQLRHVKVLQHFTVKRVQMCHDNMTQMADQVDNAKSRLNECTETKKALLTDLAKMEEANRAMAEGASTPDGAKLSAGSCGSVQELQNEIDSMEDEVAKLEVENMECQLITKACEEKAVEQTKQLGALRMMVNHDGASQQEELDQMTKRAQQAQTGESQYRTYFSISVAVIAVMVTAQILSYLGGVINKPKTTNSEEKGKKETHKKKSKTT